MSDYLIKKISSVEVTKYLKSNKNTYMSGGYFVMQPRVGMAAFDFSDTQANKAEIKFKRNSGNGTLMIISGGVDNEYQIISKTAQIITVPIGADGSVKIHRTARSAGEISIIEIKIFTQKYDSNWNEEIKKCESHKGLKLFGNDLHATEGGFIIGKEVVVITDPPNIFKIEGNKTTFLGSCRILSMTISGLPRSSPEFVKSMQGARNKLNPNPEPLVKSDRVASIKTNRKAIPKHVVPPTYVSPVSNVIFDENDPWLLRKIPKIAHFYWGGKLPFLRYVSVKSFIDLNPDWEVKIHVPNAVGQIAPTWKTGEQKNSKNTQTNSKDYMQDLAKIAKIYTHNFSDYDLDNSIHEVHKSDFIRWRLLSIEGGLWSDFDVIYHKPMKEASDNIIQNLSKNTGVCTYSNDSYFGGGSHAIGYLLSSPNNTYYRNLFSLSKRVFNKGGYQSIGVNMINSKFKSLQKSSKNCDFLSINPSTVYSITDPLKFLSSDIKISDFPDSIGFHWYGGSEVVSSYESSVNENNYKEFDTFLGKLVRLTMDK